MSHITRIKTQIQEKEYLLAALADLGYAFEEGSLKIDGFGDQSVPVEIKVPVRLSRDIGFRKVNDSYEIVADWWSVRGVKKDEFTRQVTQRYAYHLTRAKLEAQGFTLAEETQDKGTVRLVLRRSV
jgi:hypothetical protein